MLGSVEVTTRFTDSEFFKIYIFGGDLQLIHILALMMLIDIITGISKAVKNKNLKSRKSLFGYIRKILVFAIIILANMMDSVLGFNGALVVSTVWFYIANELLSIVENSAQIGMPLPPKILEILDVMQSSKGSPGKTFTEDFIDDPELKEGMDNKDTQ